MRLPPGLLYKDDPLFEHGFHVREQSAFRVPKPAIIGKIYRFSGLLHRHDSPCGEQGIEMIMHSFAVDTQDPA